jgi:hypothetical protein
MHEEVEAKTEGPKGKRVATPQAGRGNIEKDANFISN